MDTEEMIEFLKDIKNYEPSIGNMDSKKYEENIDEIIKLLQKWEEFKKKFSIFSRYFE